MPHFGFRISDFGFQRGQSAIRNPQSAIVNALALLALAASAAALADPIVSWPSLAGQRRQKGGLFATWGVDQEKVLRAVTALERSDPDRDLAALRRRAAEDPTDLAAADALAVRCWRKGLLHEAGARFRLVLALDPAFLRSRLNLADMFQELGASGLARRELAEAARLAPGIVGLRRALADALAASDDHRGAAAVWEEAIKLAPNDPQPRLSLARQLHLAGLQDAAKAALADAARLAGSDPAAVLPLADLQRAMGGLHAARERWEVLAKSQPRGPAAAQLGFLHLHRAEWRDALDRFSALLAGAPADAPATARPESRSPNWAAALAGAAAAAHGLRDAQAAAAFCRRLRADGQPRLAASLLANMALEQDYDMAQTAIKAIWSAVPGEAEGRTAAYEHLLAAARDSLDKRRELGLLLSRAEALREAGWFEQAAEALRAARERAPGSMMLGEALAACYAAAGLQDDELALREELARGWPDDSRACQARALACVRRRQWAQAEEVCRAFIKRFFGDLETRVAAAELALRRGDYEAAIADCEAVVAKHPLDPRPYASLLDALVRSGKFSEAAAAFRNRTGAVPSFVRGPLEEAVEDAAEGRSDAALARVHSGARNSPSDHRLWLMAGSMLERKGDLRGAVARYEVATWLRPHEVSAHLLLARAADRAGLPQVAREAYRAAIELGPDGLDAHLEFADALVRWGLRDEAIALLKPLLLAARATQRDKLNLRLAEAHLSGGDAARAAEIATAVLLKDPADAMARRVALDACRALGDLPTATKLCEQALAAAREAPLDADLGRLYLIARRYREAEELLSDAAGRTQQPNERLDLRKLQAAAALAQGGVQRAERALQDAMSVRLEVFPSDDGLVLELLAVGWEVKVREVLAPREKANPTGVASLRAAAAALAGDRELLGIVLSGYAASAGGWHARAAELFGAALKRAPDLPLLLHEAAKASLDAGMADPAAALAGKLAAAFPNAIEPQLLAARALEKQGKPDAALDALARAAALVPKDAGAQRLALAERLAKGGRIEDAIAALRSVVQAEPGNLAAAQKLAWLLAAHKPDQLPEAERLAALAAKGSPGDAAARDTLGWVLFLAKRPDAARAELAAALALDPRNPASYYHLGMVEFVQGRRARARRALQIALSLDPAFPDAANARSTLKALETAPEGAR
ncbi:MAG: tetratricopeptide repeat protein [Planctomycetes bacterium]|nr:tetratricopeptide repeat protein [Planctomycetota bacterium]